MRVLLTTLLLALGLLGPAATGLADDTPAAQPAAPVFTLAEAAGLLGQPLPAGAGWAPLQLDFRPFNIAAQHVRSGVTVALGEHRFKDAFMHALVVDGNVAAVRLFLQKQDELKDKELAAQARYIEALSKQLLGLNPPESDFIMPLKLTEADEEKWKESLWRYEAASGVSYTLFWTLNAETQVWVETPEFVELRKIEEAREIEGKPLIY